MSIKKKSVKFVDFMTERERKIIIIGTLGAGKTTLSRLLSKATGYNQIAIDDCREKFGDGTVTGEYSAWTCFIKECNSHLPAILEFSGCGPHAYAVRQALIQSGLPSIIIWLDLPLDICINRASERVNNVPTPYPWGAIDESVKSIHTGIDCTWHDIWTKRPEIIAIKINFSGKESIDEAYAILLDYLKFPVNKPT